MVKLLSLAIATWGLLCLVACIFVLLKNLVMWVEGHSPWFACLVGFLAILVIVYHESKK